MNVQIVFIIKFQHDLEFTKTPEYYKYVLKILYSNKYYIDS